MAGTVESYRRSMVKAVSWRVVAVAITSTVTWALTGRLDLAAMVGAVDTAIKLGAYYAHERLWSRSCFGLTIEAVPSERSTER